MRFIGWSGIALAAGGVLTVVINAALTPLLPSDASYAETAASTVFLWRQSLSALAAALLLGGSVGLYLRHTERAGRLGGVAFTLAFVGNALLLAHEWSQIFFVRGLALAAPAVLDKLDAAKGPSLHDVGALAALGAFAVGWIALAISMLFSGAYARRGPLLVIAGLFVGPLLSAAMPGAWAAILGSAVLGAGWIMLGHELHASQRPGPQS